jgi:hypothetical protein
MMMSQELLHSPLQVILQWCSRSNFDEMQPDNRRRSAMLLIALGLGWWLIPYCLIFLWVITRPS